MEGKEVTLEEMLACREKRAQIQTELLSAYHLPLVCFTLNIPGPIKTNAHIHKAYLIGKKALLDAFSHSVQAEKELLEDTGDSFFLALALSADEIKTITTQIEDESPLGRLFDMDVLTPEGKKLSRVHYRQCLICGKQAQECARARTHSVEQMQCRIEEILGGAIK